MQRQQLAKLLSQSDQMTNQLLSLRNQIVGNSVSTYYKSPSSMIVKGANHRSLLRTLAETLEANRNFQQINKQKIEKSRIVLEGLDYLKKTLKDKIQGYHTEVESIEQYFEEPLGPIDWENNYEAGENKLRGALQKLKHKDQKYRETIDQKNQLEKKITQKQKLYNNDLPKHVKRLNEIVQETTKIFGIQTNEALENIENKQLAYIYDIFKTLKTLQKIDIVYGNEQYEFIELIIKPKGLQLYERASQYKIKLQQKQVKLKISILNPDFCKLFIGIDRRNDFSNKDIFHRLINKQDAKIIFEEPINQLQRNINIKFVYVEWIQETLCASSTESSQFLQLIRYRIFSNALIRNIFDNIKHPVWLNSICPTVFSQISHKRLIVQNSQKISFQEYKQFVNIPLQIKQSLNSYEQNLRNKMDNQNQPQSCKNLYRRKKNLLQVLSIIGLQQLLIPEIYQYYRLTISFSRLKVQAVILVPYQYPSILPKIKIISFQRLGQQNYTNSINSIECKAKIDNKVILNAEAEILQKQSNQPFSVLNQAGSQPFKILYYLAKLFQTIHALQTAYNDKKKLK